MIGLGFERQKMKNYFVKKCVKHIFAVSCLLNLRLVLSHNQEMYHKSESFQHISKSCEHFCSNFFQALTSEDSQENVISSPLSAHIVLSVLFHGADGGTKKELESALHILNSHDLQNEFRNLFASFNTSEKSELEIANAMYIDNHFILQNEFSTQCKDYFQTSVEKINFKNGVESASKINEWVKEKTRGKISHIVDANDIDSYTMVMLLNALYFRSSWFDQFEPEFTEEKKFFNIDGNEVFIPTMMKTFIIPHGHIKSLKTDFIKIKYLNTDFEMIVLLPHEKYGLTDLEKNFNWRIISKAAYSTKEVELFLPKFKIEATINLKNTLMQLGINSIFQERSNFSRISEKPLHVSQVLQKLFIEVDEKGSEAAVTTAAHMRARRMTVDYENFVVDHPFMFIIHHRSSSIPLYVGSVRKLGKSTVKEEL